MTEVAELVTAQISQRAADDSLTGLPDRALLTPDGLAQAIALTQGHSKQVVLIYPDLDRFPSLRQGARLLLQPAPAGR
jgi:GGDEF domain-containing protein